MYTPPSREEEFQIEQRQTSLIKAVQDVEKALAKQSFPKSGGTTKDPGAADVYQLMAENAPADASCDEWLDATLRRNGIKLADAGNDSFEITRSDLYRLFQLPRPAQLILRTLGLTEDSSGCDISAILRVCELNQAERRVLLILGLIDSLGMGSLSKRPHSAGGQNKAREVLLHVAAGIVGETDIEKFKRKYIESGRLKELGMIEPRNTKQLTNTATLAAARLLDCQGNLTASSEASEVSSRVIQSEPLVRLGVSICERVLTELSRKFLSATHVLSSVNLAHNGAETMLFISPSQKMLLRRQMRGAVIVDAPKVSKTGFYKIKNFTGKECLRLDSVKPEQATPQDLSDYGAGDWFTTRLGVAKSDFSKRFWENCLKILSIKRGYVR